MLRFEHCSAGWRPTSARAWLGWSEKAARTQVDDVSFHLDCARLSKVLRWKNRRFLLLERSWTPPGVTLPDSGLTPEVVARIVRMTGGNLRLITRLLAQVERVLNVNDARVISVEIVEAARDSLVIGQA